MYVSSVVSLKELEEVTLVQMKLTREKERGGGGGWGRGLLAWSLSVAQSHLRTGELSLLEVRGLEFCNPPPISWCLATGHPLGESGSVTLLALG